MRHASVAGRRRLGRHRRRAGRPRHDGRREPAGRVRDPGLGHAEGDRPDRVRVRVRAGRRPEPRLRRARRASGSTRRSARRRSRRRSRKLKTPEFAPTEDKAGIESVGDPFSEDTFSDDGRIAYAEAQFDRDDLRQGPRRGRRRARTPSARRSRRPASTVEFNGDAEFPPIEQGTQELLGLLAALIVLLVVFRTFVATIDPDRARAHGAGDRVPPAVHPRRPHRHQHDHAAARVDDRPRRRHRLLAVHRHALQAAPARRAVAARRRRRGRRLRGPGRALRRPDGRDLGHRPRVLRPRLRDQARHRLGARRPDDGADRELAADRGAGDARAQDRPAEGAVPAPDRRLRGGPREDA